MSKSKTKVRTFANDDGDEWRIKDGMIHVRGRTECEWWCKSTYRSAADLIAGESDYANFRETTAEEGKS